jgi:hypothetical protein
MLKHRVGRLAGARRQGLIVGLALVAPVLFGLGITSSASAAPKGIFAVFAQCPTSTPGNALCTFAQTTSGEFAIGKTKVPINKTITLQGGGVHTGGPNPNEYFLLPAKNGESLSKTELNVPGGLLNIVNCEEIKGNGLGEKLERGTCKAIFENKTTGVTATTELVASASNPAILNLAGLFTGEETALTLPLRVHLKNPLLGEGCYIGSEKSPIQLHLTTGTTAPPAPNKPIKGNPGKFSEEDEREFGVTVVKENSLVDNAYSAPVAEGCGGLFSFLIDPIVNSKLGLPSAAGKNTAILNGSLKSAESEAVVASEKF